MAGFIGDAELKLRYPDSGSVAMDSADVFLALGSNLGAREALLNAALAGLARRGFRVTQRSSRYWTEPVGGPPQDWFLNQVVRGETALSPLELLDACLSIESEAGRTRGERNGPRTLDLDLLFYGDAVRTDARLTLPHPRLHERRFVLEPLAEIAPGFEHPVSRKTIAALLAACPDTSRVVKQEATSATPVR
jgi:2-amino-4-hydroxy-6-hydroxymethyldihydropteridine diphosphokinase